MTLPDTQRKLIKEALQQIPTSGLQRCLEHGKTKGFLLDGSIAEQFYDGVHIWPMVAALPVEEQQKVIFDEDLLGRNHLLAETSVRVWNRPFDIDPDDETNAGTS